MVLEKIDSIAIYILPHFLTQSNHFKNVPFSVLLTHRDDPDQSS
jgi:hypothetical protein